ncbi:MAG: choline ABC transporter ATP-binding protein [Acetobacteraceae bacterium]|nr:choline ABC transporter ATP-binding protein [Acetobacteraceae bacterium]
MTQAPTASAVEFRDVDILFGAGKGRRAQDAALQLLAQGRTRTEIAAETGVVVGVSGASLAVGHGEICVLMGLSGSGKSTLLRAANGLNMVTRGQVLLHDGDGAVDVASCGAAVLRRMRMERVAMVFQQFALLPWRSVRENVGLGLELRGVSPAERRRVVDEKLELVGLAQWADRFASELSGGMQQRVGLARAFATDADILLMDEPFSALDPLIRTKLQDELLALQARVRKTILFVSHDLDEALKLGNQISIMEGGRIVQTGTPEDIVLRPADAYVAEFVGHMNPLAVLRGEAVMRAAGQLRQDGAGCWLDADRRYHLALDGEERPQAARLDGAPLPVVPLDDPGGAEMRDLPPGLVMVPRDLPLRLVVQVRQASGHPVLLGDGGRFSGVCDDAEILGALCGIARRPQPVPTAAA